MLLRPALALLVLGSLSLSACVERESGLTRTERQQLEPFIHHQRTQPEHALNIQFEDKLKIIGYDLSADRVAPGEEFTVTWHWEVLHAIDEGWMLFTHTSGPNEDGNGMIRQLYPPSQWKAGEFILDRQTIRVPDDFRGSAYELFLGVWRGDARMRVTEGRSDDNRARALSVPIDRAQEASAAPIPRLTARRAEAITLDGELSEEAWQRAGSTGAFHNTRSGGEGAFHAEAKVLWDEEQLYVAFEVHDTRLFATHEQHDDHLWEQDCVEIMIDPDGDGRNYFELQVSPKNVSFDTRYDARRDPQPIGHADWDSNLRSAVQLRGSLNDSDDDEGYTVEIAIPWSAFNAGEPPAARPSESDTWRVNFYVMDSRDENSQRAVGWSAPLVGDFHVPDRFGHLTFRGPTAPPEAEAPEAATAR